MIYYASYDVWDLIRTISGERQLSLIFANGICIAQIVIKRTLATKSARVGAGQDWGRRAICLDVQQLNSKLFLGYRLIPHFAW